MFKSRNRMTSVGVSMFAISTLALGALTLANVSKAASPTSGARAAQTYSPVPGGLDQTPAPRYPKGGEGCCIPSTGTCTSYTNSRSCSQLGGYMVRNCSADCSKHISDDETSSAIGNDAPIGQD